MSLAFEEALHLLETVDSSQLSAEQIKRSRRLFDKFVPNIKGLTTEQRELIALTRADNFELATNRGVTTGMTKAVGKARAWHAAMSSEEFTEMIVKAIKGARLDPHYCGWNDSGTVYSGWDNLLRDASRIDRHVQAYENAVATGNFSRRSINKTGKGGKEKTLDVLKANPEAVFSTDASKRMLAVLAGAPEQAHQAQLT